MKTITKSLTNKTMMRKIKIKQKLLKEKNLLLKILYFIVLFKRV